MRKAEAVLVLARRLGVKRTRLTNITQRLAEAGLLPISHGPPFPQLSPTEIARMTLAAIVDEGISAAPATVRRVGGWLGRGCSLEQGLGHALQRPETLAPSKASLIVHKTYATLTTARPDGLHTDVYGDVDDDESVANIVKVSGVALRGIAEEIGGSMSAADVDQLLAGIKT
jgi:hypothetical protein